MFSKIAVTAAELLQSGNLNPYEAWEKSLVKHKKDYTKDCPKNTFLGLCQEGYIKNVRKGRYTKASKNLDYAKEGVRILKTTDKRYEKHGLLWKDIRSNLSLEPNPGDGQAPVILGLWEAGYIK